MQRHRPAVRAALWLAAALAAAAAPCRAASFEVSPTRLEFDGSQRVLALTIRNASDADTDLQVELYRWAQRDGHDDYTPTSDLLATPPVFTLPAGSQQIVRVGLRRSSDPQQELAYRLFVQELPSPAPAGFRGLRMMLRMGLPIFVAPDSGRASPRLQWHATRGDDGTLQLSVDNDGSGRAQLARLQLKLGDETLAAGGMVYALPGAQQRWSLRPARPGAADEVALTATVNGEPIAERIRID